MSYRVRPTEIGEWPTNEPTHTPTSTATPEPTATLGPEADCATLDICNYLAYN